MALLSPSREDTSGEAVAGEALVKADSLGLLDAALAHFSRLMLHSSPGHFFSAGSLLIHSPVLTQTGMITYPLE